MKNHPVTQMLHEFSPISMTIFAQIPGKNTWWLRSATNTLVVNRPMINILILRFTSLEITQEVSALSLTKINCWGGFLWKKVKKIHFGHLVTPMRDLTFIQQLSNSHISNLLSFLCALVMFLNTVANQAVEICRNLAGKRRKMRHSLSLSLSLSRSLSLALSLSLSLSLVPRIWAHLHIAVCH